MSQVAGVLQQHFGNTADYILSHVRPCGPAAPAGARAGAGVGCRARLRDPAHPPVLDHPVASLRLHDDQRCPAGLRCGGYVRDLAARSARDAVRSGVRRQRGGVRRSRCGRIPDRAARALQRPRVPVGSVAAAAAGADLPAAVRAVLLRGGRRVPHVYALRGRGRAGLQLRHTGRCSRLPGRRAAAVPAAAAGCARLRDGAAAGGCCFDRVCGSPAPTGLGSGAPGAGCGVGVGGGGSARSAADVTVQGPQPDAAGDGHAGAGADLQPARPGHA